MVEHAHRHDRVETTQAFRQGLDANGLKMHPSRQRAIHRLEQLEADALPALRGLLNYWIGTLAERVRHVVQSAFEVLRGYFAPLRPTGDPDLDLNALGAEERAAAEGCLAQAAEGGGYILSGTDAGIYRPEWVASFLVMGEVARGYRYV